MPAALFEPCGTLRKHRNGLREIDDERLERSARRENIEVFIRTLENSDGLITKFDEDLWIATVEFVTVHTGHDITFTFKDGMEFGWKI